MIRGVPLKRGWRATVTLRSGATVAFSCDDMLIRWDKATLALQGLTAERSPDFPDYLQLADVSAITSRRVWRTRPFTLGERRFWVVALLSLVGLAISMLPR